jgi:hypothetical protein
LPMSAATITTTDISQGATKSAVELRCGLREAATPLKAAPSETEWVADLQHGSLVTAELSEAVGSTVERAVEPQKPLEITQPPATSLKALGTSLGSPALSAQSLGNTALRALTSDPACANVLPFGWHLFNEPGALQQKPLRAAQPPNAAIPSPATTDETKPPVAPRESAAAVAAPEATADVDCMSVSALRSALKGRGLSANGRRPALQRRFAAALGKTEENVPPIAPLELTGALPGAGGSPSATSQCHLTMPHTTATPPGVLGASLGGTGTAAGSPAPVEARGSTAPCLPAPFLGTQDAALGNSARSTQSLVDVAGHALASNPACANDMPTNWYLGDAHFPEPPSLLFNEPAPVPAGSRFYARVGLGPCLPRTLPEGLIKVATATRPPEVG